MFEVDSIPDGRSNDIGDHQREEICLLHDIDPHFHFSPDKQRQIQFANSINGRKEERKSQPEHCDKGFAIKSKIWMRYLFVQFHNIVLCGNSVYRRVIDFGLDDAKDDSHGDP